MWGRHNRPKICLLARKALAACSQLRPPPARGKRPLFWAARSFLPETQTRGDTDETGTRESPAATTPRARNSAENNAIIRQGQWQTHFFFLWHQLHEAEVRTCTNAGIKLQLRIAAMARHCVFLLQHRQDTRQGSRQRDHVSWVQVMLFCIPYRICELEYNTGRQCLVCTSSLLLHVTGTTQLCPVDGAATPAHETLADTHHIAFLWCRMTNHLPSPRPSTPRRADTAAPGWLQLR